MGRNRLQTFEPGGILAVCLAVAVSFVAGSFGVAAQSNDVSVLAERLNRLEKDLRDVQRDVYRRGGKRSGGGEAAPAGAGAADVALRVSDVERELGRLTGDVEELAFQIQQMSLRMQQLEADLDAELGESLMQEGPAAGPASPAAGPAPLSDPNAALSGAAAEAAREPLSLPADPDAAFDYARRLLLNGDFAAAETAFTAYLEAHPGHSKAAEANYWLGETFYVRGAYKQAADAFLDSVRKYPQGARGPESLLKLGMSLFELGESGEACKTYRALPSRYPGASETVLQRVEVERRRAGC